MAVTLSVFFAQSVHFKLILLQAVQLSMYIFNRKLGSVVTLWDLIKDTLLIA